MTRTILIAAILMLGIFKGFSQNDLFGKVTRDSLYKYEWYTQGYKAYQPDQKVIQSINSKNLQEIGVRIFFGTWCGDTKRELPRIMKVMDAIGIKEEKIKLFAVSNEDTFYKQSKLREEKGFYIFRVGTFIVERNEVEINRITEYPKLSMEQDLVDIINGQNYVPQYPVYVKIKEWLLNGTLKSGNVSAYNLEPQVKNLVTKSGELNGCGYVLMANKQFEEALKIFQINTLLYPESSNVWHSLAECAYKMGNKELSEKCLERGLKVQGASELVREYLDLHKKVILLP